MDFGSRNSGFFSSQPVSIACQVVNCYIGVETLGAGTCSTYRCCVGNLSNGDYSASLGGFTNVVESAYSAIVGGSNNTISGSYSSILGGSMHCISGAYSNISGGFTNDIQGDCSSISGGHNNTIILSHSFIGGGECNTASAYFDVIVGGSENTTNGTSLGFIGNGVSNSVLGQKSSILNGTCNIINGSDSSILGGCTNVINCSFSSILGGINNNINHANSFIIGSCLVTTQACTTFMNCASANNLTAGCAVCVGTNKVLVNAASGARFSFAPLIGIVDGGGGDDPVSGGSTFTSTKLIGLGASNGNKITIQIDGINQTNFGTNQSFTFDAATGEIDLDYLGSGNQWIAGSGLYVDLNQ